jgi:hypothetical protein
MNGVKVFKYEDGLPKFWRIELLPTRLKMASLTISLPQLASWFQGIVLVSINCQILEYWKQVCLHLFL